MDRYEIGLDVDRTEPAEARRLASTLEHAQAWARELSGHYPKRNVYVFDRMASWRQVQCWHYINGELVPISWRS